MNKIKINCDVGEGVGNESKLMPYIHFCNIACGGHAGDVNSMSQVVDMAIAHEVLIGAHPSYPDRENFGRKSMQISSDELIASIQYQIESLLKITKSKKTALFHIKAHGALYNDIAKDNAVVQTFLKAIRPYRSSLKLFVAYGSILEEKAIESGFSIIYEAFADRNYNNDLSLVPRSFSNALINNIDDVLFHVRHIMETGSIVTVQNKKIPIKATTFCVHSDTDNAVSIVKALNEINCNY